MKLLRLMLASLCVFAPLAHAEVIQLNLTTVYNIDGVGNIGDTTQTSLDANDDGGNFVYMTQSLANALAGGSGNGVADSGLYAANGSRPAVQMGYGLNPNGNNVLQFAGTGPVNLAMGGKRYSEIHVAAMTGGGTSFLTLVLHYADGNATTRTAVVNDWYNDFPATDDDYYFADGLDRVKSDLSYMENANDPALFGYRFLLDSNRELLSIDFVPAGTSSFSPRLNIFGAAAVTADVPEPGTIALMLAGLAGLFAYKRKQS